MRDSLIAILVLAGIVGAYHYLKNRGLLVDSTVPLVAESSPKKASQHAFAKGAAYAHAPVTKRRSSTETSSQDQRNSGAAAKAENLTSIYPSEGKDASEPAVTAENATDANGLVAEQKPKVLYGVPLAAWIASQKDRLVTSVQSDGVNTGMKVYLQCLELKKKGPLYVGEESCEHLLEGSNPSKLEHATAKHPWFPLASGG